MTLGQNIQNARKAKGMSQEALAEKIGVSRQALGKWEKDTALPGLDNLQALAAELEFGALSQEEYDRMFACREELQQVRADIAAIEKATPAAGDLDSQLKAARAEIDQCKLKLQYLAQYISKRAEMTFSALEMNRVEISLYDVVKSTGEVKDAFKFTYNGRRYRAAAKTIGTAA